MQLRGNGNNYYGGRNKKHKSRKNGFSNGIQSSNKNSKHTHKKNGLLTKRKKTLDKNLVQHPATKKHKLNGALHDITDGILLLGGKKFKREGYAEQNEEMQTRIEPNELITAADFRQHMRVIINKEYSIVREEFENDVKINGKETFEKSCITSKHVMVASEIQTLHEFDLIENNTISADVDVTMVRNVTTGTVLRCPTIPLEAIQSTPPMQYWTLTEANVIAEDEYTLSHIPFLGDQEDDTSFCAELMKAFPEGIHGTKEGCGQYINDYILFYTIIGVTKQLPKTCQKTILKAIYEQFPNKAPVHELISMLPDLQLRFEPDEVDRPEFVDDSGQLVANFSASRLLNSYDVLLCHKCYSYDCIMHAATIADRYTGRQRSRHSNSKRRSMSRERETITPCSDNCYSLHFSDLHYSKTEGSEGCSVNGRSLAKQLNIEIGNTNAASGPKVDWTPHDESIFNLLRSTGEMDFCRIADFMSITSKNSKTCRDVYDYARRTAPISPRLELQQSPVKKCKKMKDTHRTFRAAKWASTNGLVANTSMFKPCKHKGPCNESKDCYCVNSNNLCTKYCACNDDCRNRFPGCRCAPGNCRTKQCQCYFASWECDPDICKSCNCDKFDNSCEPICKNVSIQRGLQKRLLIAPSQVAGWGCFANDDIDKNEFISEYCGEVISQAESDRRGKIYDKIKFSYLFGLNDEQTVDATRIGNVIRFANHSQNPNCRARVIVVNGDHRIGIFAQRPIAAGEELFFDYAYNRSQQIEFVPKELQYIPNRQKRALTKN